MSGLNLHNIVDGALASVQPSVAVKLYQSTGQENIKGQITAKYAEPFDTAGRWQSESEQLLKQLDKVNESDIIRKVYLYHTDSLKPSPLSRPLGRTGDIIYKVDDNSWWLITALKEDYSNEGWVCVRATRQLTKPEGVNV